MTRHSVLQCQSVTRPCVCRCYAVTTGSLRLTLVDSSLCERRWRLEKVQDCSLPCPGDCVLAHWTHWTPCRQVGDW